MKSELYIFLFYKNFMFLNLKVQLVAVTLVGENKRIRKKVEWFF